MTSSWNNFSIGKVDPVKDSTTDHTDHTDHTTATSPLQSTLNLASLTSSHPEAPHPADPKPAPGSGNFLDAGAGFITGVGKQTLGTAQSMFGVDQDKFEAAVRRGGSGQGVGGMGAGDVAKKMYDGLSSTVSLVYNNPSALAAIPGQLMNNFSQGDWRTRGDMLGQATVLIGSLYTGGSGVAKATSIAGDVREASTVAKGISSLTEAGGTMRSLETSVVGLTGDATRTSTLIGDAGRTSSLIGDATRTSTLIGDGANVARTTTGLLGDTRAVTAEASTLLKTGSFADRVLPATEGATKFLVKGDTASSLGVSELSMPNRVLGLQTTENGAGVFSKFMNRLRTTTTEGEGLAAKVGPLQRFGRTGESVAAEVGAVTPKVEGLTAATPKVETLIGRTEGVAGQLPGAATETGGIVARTETVVPRVATEAERLAGQVPHVATEAERLAGQVPHVATEAERLAGQVPHVVTEAERVAVQAPHVVPEAETLAGIVQKVDTAPGAVVGAESRLTNVSRVGETVAPVVSENAGTISRIGNQVRTATTEIAEHTSTLTTQTSELVTKFGGSASVRELEVASKQMSQATSAAEKAQALAAVEKATAKVTAELPAEATTGLRSTVEAFKAPLQVVARGEAVEVAATQIAERSTTLTKQVESLATASPTPAVQELSTATRQLNEAKTVAEKAEAFASIEKVTAKVAAEVPADTATALRNTVESLRTPVQAASRAEAFEVAATQVADHSATLTSQTAELSTKFGTKPAVQELSAATKQFTEAATYAERAQALSAVERASVKVANEVPEAGAALKQTVEGLKAPVQTAMLAEATDVFATQIAQRSSQLTSDTASLAAKLGENPAVRDLNAATKEFTQASGAVERAEAFAKVEKAATAVKDLSPEGAQVARTVESLSAPVENAARAQRLERAVANVDESASTLSSQTKALVQELTVDGKVPASVRELDNAAARFGSAGTATERAEALQAIQKSAAEVSTEFPGKSAQIAKTLESVAPRVETAERLTQFENVTSKVASHADDVARDANALKGTAPKAEAALSEMEKSANSFSKTTNAAERADQLSSMNKNLGLVQAEVGEAKAAGLRTSLARLENEAGTMDRVASVDKSVNAVAAQSQSVVRGAAELEAGTTNVAARNALQNISRGAEEAGTVNALNRTELLARHAQDISIVETQLGTAAGAQMRTALSELDRATAAARHQSIDLVEYQGAKIAQQMGYLQDGALGTHTQAARLGQLEHDLAVMKSVVPADSPIAPHLVRLEQQMHGVDAISNILSHPEVARAPGKELLRLAQSTDAATATAAADRLILRGKLGEIGDGPVAGLLSERAQFWSSQKQLVQLEDVAKSKLFESGKLFGISTSDPVFKKALADIAWVAGGAWLLGGTARYELTQLSAMARDNVLSAQQESISKEQTKKEERQAQTFDQESKAAAVAAAVQQAGTTTATDSTTSNQSVFKTDSTAAVMSPAVQVYGAPKLASEAVHAGNRKKDHNDQPLGFNFMTQLRGPGAATVSVDEVRQTAAIVPRTRGMAVTPEADLTKVASTRFPIPRVLDISNQANLLNSGTNQFSSRVGRPGTMAGSGAPSRTWTTVDWSQVGSHRVAASEGGKANKDLTKLEKDEEHGIDGSGGGSSTTTAANPVLSQAANDPSVADPNAASQATSNDPNIVVASNAQTQDDQKLAKI